MKRRSFLGSLAALAVLPDALKALAKKTPTEEAPTRTVLNNQAKTLEWPAHTIDWSEGYAHTVPYLNGNVSLKFRNGRKYRCYRFCLLESNGYGIVAKEVAWRNGTPPVFPIPAGKALVFTLYKGTARSPRRWHGDWMLEA